MTNESEYYVMYTYTNPANAKTHSVEETVYTNYVEACNALKKMWEKFNKHKQGWNLISMTGSRGLPNKITAKNEDGLLDLKVVWECKEFIQSN